MLSKADKMKRIQKIGILALVVAILMAASILYLVNNNKTDLTESEAISLLKAAYPESRNYPNENLPPQSIQTKQATNGWYVAFVQEGSGRPVLEAKCFLVTDDNTITSIGEYVPEVGEDRYNLSGENIFNLWVK
jgi:flagellar basal body-associated protein FliL